MSISKETFMTAGSALLSFDDSLRALVSTSFDAWGDFVALPQSKKDSASASRETNWEGYGREKGIERFIAVGNTELLSSNDLFGVMSKRALDIVGSVSRALDIQALKDLQADEYEVVLRYEHHAEPSKATYVDHGGLLFILAVTDGAFEQYHEGIWNPLGVTEKKYCVAGGMQLQLTTENRVQAFQYRVTKKGAMMLSCHVRFKGAALKAVEKHVVGYKSLSREFSSAWRQATSSKD